MAVTGTSTNSKRWSTLLQRTKTCFQGYLTVTIRRIGWRTCKVRKFAATKSAKRAEVEEEETGKEVAMEEVLGVEAVKEPVPTLK